MIFLVVSLATDWREKQLELDAGDGASAGLSGGGM